MKFLENILPLLFLIAFPYLCVALMTGFVFNITDWGVVAGVLYIFITIVSAYAVYDIE